MQVHDVPIMPLDGLKLKVFYDSIRCLDFIRAVDLRQTQSLSISKRLLENPSADLFSFNYADEVFLSKSPVRVNSVYSRYLGGIGRIVSHQNPSTREFKILPQSTVQRPPGLLDFSSFNCLGFGYDSQTDDFKVIRFVTHYFEENLDEGLIADWTRQVELYSLKNDSWKEIPFTGVYAFASTLFNN
ncbi:uncharacterized protein LOC120176257 [Hibiscus syriacus]|uniref:uncharacterized protein LOC120176257 n=1 Tax=Hibiscus syriacus TaxID=106335 RepID=UPI001922B231|nr:uncharacterized protein LOC120176257 [Hibiscus syriacus]